MKRAAVALACACIVGACANDFDALFEGGPVEDKADSGKSSGSSNGGAGDDDDTVKVPDEQDAEAQPISKDPSIACGKPPAKCVDEPAGGFNTCSGCGCKCNQTCSGPGIECSIKCTDGSNCNGTCERDFCDFTTTASRSDLKCDALECTLGCKSGSICTLDCSLSRRCRATCDANSQCTVKICDSFECSVDCPDAKRCPDGLTFVCGGAECP